MQYVFSYNCQPIWQVNTKARRNAVKASGVTDFRWHNLPHTWASWHARAGTPINVVQEMAGWKSHEMALRYSHLLTRHLVLHAARIEGRGDSAKDPQAS